MPFHHATRGMTKLFLIPFGLILIVAFHGCTTEEPPTVSISPNNDSAEQEHVEAGLSRMPTLRQEVDGAEGVNRKTVSNDREVTRVAQSVTNDGSTPFRRDEALARPIVQMSQEHEETCLVKVGDDFPSLSLTDLSGGSEALATYLGKRLTVVVFWSLQQPYASEQYSYLHREIVQPYGNNGVDLVAINVGDSVDDVKSRVKEEGGEFTNFVDPERVAFQQVATMKLPRTYLLDAGGSILWFDIEYSRSTRRNLDRAIRFFLSSL